MVGVGGAGTYICAAGCLEMGYSPPGPLGEPALCKQKAWAPLRQGLSLSGVWPPQEDKSLSLLVPQFSHLWNGDYSSLHYGD